MRHPNFDDARPLIEEEIERLIGVLDLLEEDPDLEENGDWDYACEDEGAYDDSELEADEPDAPRWPGDFVPVYREVFR